jgi:hypothetical protein
VKGSVPRFSLVVPVAEVVAFTENVRGIRTEQEFPLVVTVAPVMDFLSLKRVHKRLGLHWLRIILLALRYGGKIFGDMLDSLAGHTVDEGNSEVVVLDGDDWPGCAGWC